MEGATGKSREMSELTNCPFCKRQLVRKMLRRVGVYHVCPQCMDAAKQTVEADRRRREQRHRGQVQNSE
jgi:hypothetical protein